MPLPKTDRYNHTEHIFRLAAWSSSTAARSSPKCRFSVKVGSKILRSSDLYKFSIGFNYLPEHNQFDKTHEEFCYKIIQSSKKYLPKEKYDNFSYGIAAKLLNCYFKSIYLIQFQSGLDKTTESKIKVIHPPIDNVLLTALSNNKNEKINKRDEFWRKMASRGWSKFQKNEYINVIEKIKEVQKEKNEPLWMIERAWQGFQ